MAKQLTGQRFVYKIHSDRLRRNKWKLILPLDEARRNDEVISLADSQVLRWIDEFNGVSDADEHAKRIKSKIRHLKKQPTSIQNKRQIRQLYKDLDAVLFKPDYLCLVIDKTKDYWRACKGFTINGVKYKRLLGTNGGIKNSTIVFVSDKVVDMLQEKINNNRNEDVKLVTAKLEAYKALACSASTPVSMPHGVLVVPDCETSFLSDTIYITDEYDGEPVCEFQKNHEVVIDATDGCGIILPSLAERWSEELKLDYVISGANSRNSWEKGMLYTFDFVDFAEKEAGSYIVKDAWGDEVDVRNVELVLTTSMLKLWDSYDSCNSYLESSIGNGYTFCITKVCPKELESVRTTNYQFIQSLNMTDKDIDDLIQPTIDEIKDVLSRDRFKTILYLKGIGLCEGNVMKCEDDFAKALMIDERMLNDPFVRKSVYNLIRNRIDEAKVGVLNVHGNYSMASGDLYALCQSMFGLPVSGLLRPGEIYNRYWIDKNVPEVLCFRAPMTCHNNILRKKLNYSDEAAYWFRHMKTCTIFNAWDTSMSALNGMDFDGDLVMLTDNPVLMRCHEQLPALMCAQRKAEKRISSEEDFIQSNIDSFGNEIGQTTNWITSMFEVQSRFDKESEEYKTLAYRIMCGQLYQQNAIDKAKGIICKPMPREWHDRHSVNIIEDENKKRFYRSVVAERKPYFMRYVYPDLKKQYNQYLKNTDKNCLREFSMTVNELRNIPEIERTERQSDFLKYYEYRMPVGMGDCIMNKICRRFENEFDGIVSRYSAFSEFDYGIMKSDVEYSPNQFSAIKKLYTEYNKRVQNYIVYSGIDRVDEAEQEVTLNQMSEEFRRECELICTNEETLCDIVLDLCYLRDSSKSFAWSMCGETIIHNLLKKNGNTVEFPILDDSGEIEYHGNNFSVASVRVWDIEVLEMEEDS